MNTQASIKSFVLAAALAGVPACALASAPFAEPATRVVAPANSELLRVGIAQGPSMLLVGTPDAPESDAQMVTIDADGNQHLTPGHRLRSRVIVQAADKQFVDAALLATGSKTPVLRVSDSPGPLSEFFILDLPTVRAAAVLADALRADPRIAGAYLDAIRPTVLRDAPSDPGFAQQWFLNNTANPAACTNVMPAWSAGFTGTGITVGITEYGFNADHPDIAPNFNALASQTPTWSPGFIDHGTATAGLVAAVANNGKGGAGVAYNARVSRQYIGFDTETQAAFSFRNDLNFIKSNSWGPNDNATIAFMSPLEQAGLLDAVTNGRNGKGEVFVWACGNGGNGLDRVDYDPYASNRYVIAVGSADNTDRRAAYSEPGSSLMVVTTSSYDLTGSFPSGIYTSWGSATSGAGDYISAFGGTSAASPIAAGVVALVLQANPNLTWRDVQHVLVRSARHIVPPPNPGAYAGWIQNGAGRWISYDFGFGAIDAGAAVALAQTFTNRAPEVAVSSSLVSPGLNIPDNNTAGLTSTVVIPSNLLIEHVELVLNAPHSRLGDLHIELVSPSGTVSVLADTRSDFSTGYNNYTLTTVRNWDERAGGTWTLRISDRTAGSTGTLANWRIKVYGAPPTCPADWDHSGVATIDDLFLFLNDWFAGLGDFGNNGTNEVDDIFQFLSAWFAAANSPCPAP